MVNFCLDTKLYKQWRRTGFGHGLSDEEKKNTRDNFELHLELGNWINIALVLIGFFLPKMALLVMT